MSTMEGPVVTFTLPGWEACSLPVTPLLGPH